MRLLFFATHIHPEALSCAKDADCADGAVCSTIFNGYYVVSLFCVVVGSIIMYGIVIPKTKYMDALPKSAWLVNKVSKA